MTDEEYLGKTSRYGKVRINEHLDDVRKYLKDGKLSDSFASYFAKMAMKEFKDKEFKDISRENIRSLFNFEIIWSGNSLMLNRRFGTSNCQLCNRERLELLRRPNCINAKSEIFHKCKHRSRFPRYVDILH